MNSLCIRLFNVLNYFWNGCLDFLWIAVDNVVIATKGLQDRSTNIIAGTTVENKGDGTLQQNYLTTSIPINKYVIK